MSKAHLRSASKGSGRSSATVMVDPAPVPETPDTPPISKEAFRRLATYVTDELGIKMPDAKMTMLQNRLMRRVRQLGLKSVDEYSSYFFNNVAEREQERQQLVNLVTTNKTDFYREPEHFVFLERTVLPDWQARHRHARFKIWSAGCSSGEEPYTMAMLLTNYAEGSPGFDFGVLATDISTNVLERAYLGIYTELQVAPLPAQLRSKYLLRSREGDSRVRIKPELRQRVSFHLLNLMDDEYAVRDTFDVIFFRNVMIYFDKETQEKVINRLSRHLAKGGYLFIGHSESLNGLDVPLTFVRASTYRKA